MQESRTPFCSPWQSPAHSNLAGRFANGRPIATIVAGLFSLCGIFACAGEVMAIEASPGEQLFVRRIAPLLHNKCVSCHGSDAAMREGELDLSDQRSALAGGSSGQPAWIAGQPDSSPLLQAVLRTSEDWSPMPPKEAEALNAEQVSWLKAWLNAGAPWPDTERQAEIAAAYAESWSAEDGITVATSAGLSTEWNQRKYQPAALWAYQPLRKDPQGWLQSAEAQGRNPIDLFLEARLPSGLQVAPEAERTQLIRRATYDLTGLPPTPEEVAAFVADPRPTASALAALVDHLLASPHYGERMAQHWLDVTRYADSSGFANDYERGNAWRYRDYVVRAFNSDKPYTAFVREQLAGDEIDPSNPEAIIATGMLRMGPWELTGMEVARVARQRFLDDVTNSVGESFLAHSLQCARCHDHKFDPVPTRDYYAMQAVFANTQLVDRPAPFLPEENVGGFEEQEYLNRRSADHQATLNALDQILLSNADAWLTDHNIDPTEWHKAVQQARKQRGKRGVFEAARQLLLKQGAPEEHFPPKLVGFTPQQFGMERISRKGLERLAWELERYQPIALAVYNGATPDAKSINAPIRLPEHIDHSHSEKTHILAGGDPFSPTVEVAPGALSAVQLNDVINFPSSPSGRRSALAEWICAQSNPLTPRVMVNRLWLWHFGRPLAGNPNNFGTTGKAPVHRELLDWLALTFMEEGWSCKAIHRRIMTSEAYRRAATHPQPRVLAELDPDQQSYAVFQPRRLSAEEIRDTLLFLSGELNLAVGGIPCRPEIHPDVALQPRQVMGTFAAAWIPNPKPQDRHRRSLYVLKLRGLVDPLLEVFNAPAPDFSCERRETSIVTPQVFALLNSRDTQRRALAMADRVLRKAQDDQAAITLCFQLAYARDPSPGELELCLQHWQAVQPSLQELAGADELPPLEVVREAIEENTGQRFTFREQLHANAAFTPDLRASKVDARTRALAQVCLALMNSNELAMCY